MIIQICVGSSCHIKGSAKIVEMTQKFIEERGLENEVTLAGSFCTGKCSREGVTVQIDDDIFSGLIPENYGEFLNKEVLCRL